MKKPGTIFVDITLKTSDGSKLGLREYFSAAYAALKMRAIENNAFIAVVGRRARVSDRALTRSMRRHGFYGKEK